MSLSWLCLCGAGLLKEYETPEKLLEDKSSLFAKLVAEYSIRSSSSVEHLSNLNQ